MSPPDPTPPEDYRAAFLRLALEYECLKFGDFTLKSGRKSPYFFNAGAFNDGAALEQVGTFYAQAAAEAGIRFDMLFGPAYKGIPLATVAACAFQRLYGRIVPVGFDRKEVKDHGDQGHTFGAPVEGRVLLVDDVISSGITVRGSVDLIRSLGATPVGLVILMDRGERGQGRHSAAQELEENCDIPVIPVACAGDFHQFLKDVPQYQQYHEQVEDYLRRYGV